MFHAALKTNDYLAFGALTGCLRVSKESIFTEMNNLKVNSIAKGDVNESFGFKENEVDNMLQYYNIVNKKAEVKEWYDGYKFGKFDIYCPWDVINYCQDIKTGSRSYAVSYWANSSSNSLVREFVDIATEQTKGELEKLVLGEHIEKKIREELTYRDLDGSIDNLWSILYILPNHVVLPTIRLRGIDIFLPLLCDSWLLYWAFCCIFLLTNFYVILELQFLSFRWADKVIEFGIIIECAHCLISSEIVFTK